MPRPLAGGHLGLPDFSVLRVFSNFGQDIFWSQKKFQSLEHIVYQTNIKVQIVRKIIVILLLFFKGDRSSCGFYDTFS